jgi:hypothetical protein
MEAAGYPAGLFYHRLMARMDAVEITDGDSGAAVRTFGLVMSEDAHAQHPGCEAKSRFQAEDIQMLREGG